MMERERLGERVGCIALICFAYQVDSLQRPSSDQRHRRSSALCRPLGLGSCLELFRYHTGGRSSRRPDL